MGNGSSTPENGQRKRPDQHSRNKIRRRADRRWTVKVVLTTFALSIALSFLSTRMVAGISIAVAFAVLALFIALGIVFDIIGIAVTYADEKPFHSMSARKVRGSREAVALLRSASKVANICNDVVGDIAGILSGAIGAAIVSYFSVLYPGAAPVIAVVTTAAITSATVGGKALGKSLAIEHSTRIVHFAGEIIYYFRLIFKGK